MDEQAPHISFFEKLKAFYFSCSSFTKYSALTLVVFGAFYFFFCSAPLSFPAGSVVSIQDGESLQTITSELAAKSVIRSPFVFRSMVILFGGERRVVSGDYLLKRREGVFVLAYRFARGKTEVETVKITIPEGWSVREISAYLQTKLVHFDAALFTQLATPLEGYLFPDTYFVSPLITPDLLVLKMKRNFDQKRAALTGIKSFGKPLSDVVTMASLLEDEARTTESRQIIAGILWKRLSLGMPLQVDSTIAYVTQKSLLDLRAEDLQINSPYNTYKYAGLPPGPIGNPGVDALTAAVTPLSTPYLYYISDKNGEMHYAKTFEEHKRNIQKYLVR